MYPHHCFHFCLLLMDSALPQRAEKQEQMGGNGREADSGSAQERTV